MQLKQQQSQWQHIGNYCSVSLPGMFQMIGDLWIITLKCFSSTNSALHRGAIIRNIFRLDN
ncbi:UNVERIFIED_CONTAM: hypothetical protein FKN15_028426 [Acipenser sinensis]